MDIMNLVVINFEKLGIGCGIFLLAYFANIMLGAWKNVKIEGYQFNWKLIAQSGVKFVVLGFGIGILSIVISIIPAYSTYVGIAIEDDMVEMIDNIVIIGAFLTATIRYVVDGVSKLKDILDV